MNKRWLLTVLLCLVVMPVVSSAKSAHYKGYERGSGKSVSVAEPIGWPIKLQSGNYLNATIESLPGMAVLRVKPYKPWWKVLGSLHATTTISVSGLPANTDLHIYTYGYRDHEIIKSNAAGSIKLNMASKTGAQFIIKTKPSTWHISSDPIFASPGRDCNSIGTWTASIKTCTLTGDVNQTISIDDNDITLNGAGKSVRGDGTGDGIYTNYSNVKIKNVEVHNFARGIVYADAVLTFADGGEVNHVVTADNTRGVVDEGVSNVKITDSDIVVNGTGVELIDQLDGFATDGITITRNNFKLNTGSDITNDGTTFVLDNASERGNWWAKNAGCTQAPSPASPNECTNTYSVAGVTDNAPWACESGWRSGVVCPRGAPPPPPVAGATWGEVSTSAGISSLYVESGLTSKLKTLPNQWVLKIIDSSSSSWKVEDITDGTVGWIPSVSLRLVTDQASIDRAQKSLDDLDTRKSEIVSIVDHYYTNLATQQSLLSSDDKNTLGTTSAISSLNKYGFPSEIVLAMIAQESTQTSGRSAPTPTSTVVSTSYNNELKTYDAGYGYMQITSTGFRGKSTGYTTSDEKCTVFRYVFVKKFNTFKPEYTCKFYTNTVQGSYSNIKDGLATLVTKYNKSLAKNASSTEVIKWAGGVWRYNGDFPDAPGSDYLALVSRKLSSLGSEFPGYTSGLNDVTLLSSSDIKLVKDTFSNYTAGQIKSPADLRVIDVQNRITGLVNGTELNNIPRSDYEDERFIIYDINGQYTYNVVGRTTGTYGLVLVRVVDGVLTSFNAIDIPIVAKMIHEYSVDWAHLTPTSGVTVRIDTNGDDRFDRTITGGATITADKFAKDAGGGDKKAVCHRPPGNPGNAHTLFLPASAISAHIGHGDSMGECKPDSRDKEVKKTDKKEDKKEQKKEEKGNKKNK